ncbi:MAG: hypothetical protein ABIO78_05575 [Thermoanaerobaculia bacterium]
MRKSLVLIIAVLLAGGCASMKSDSGLGSAKVSLTRPDVQLSQLSTVPAAARHVEGGLPIQYRLRIGNRSGEPITLKSVTLQSMGSGAYDVPTTSRPFTKLIPPDQFEIVEFWVPANVSNSTIMGANGPVTLRATLQFDSPVGQFQEVVVQQVNAMPGRDNAQ